MPLVFVHGVNVRDDGSYYQDVNARNSFFKRFALSAVFANPQAVDIFNPYWGQYGVKFAWNQASLPQSGIEELGPEDELPLLLLHQTQLSETPDTETVLLQVARRSLEEAVDLLWGVSSQQVDPTQAEALADLAVRATDYVAHNPHPAWLDAISNDRAFLRDLQLAVEDWQPQGPFSTTQFPTTQDSQNWEALGFDDTWEQIKEGASRLKGAVSSLAGRTLVDIARPGLHHQASRFMGDVLVYLQQRGTKENPGAIVREVMAALEQASNQIHSQPQPKANKLEANKLEDNKLEDDKLIVIAHSMGGNISYDILTHFRPDIQVDVFVTVGSQVALLEEMKLFMNSDPSQPPNPKTDRLPLPPNIKRWLNVFDYNDVFGFAAAGVFQGVQDFSYVTGKGVISAHTTYFTRPSLHRRLGERLNDHRI